MAIIATDTGGGSDFEPLAQGTHLAVCDMVVDLGRQRTTYMGDEKITRQVYIRWQVPSERVKWTKDDAEHEGPAVIGKTYTLSLGDKANLRRDLQAWRGKAFTPDELTGFDIANLLGIPATITVTHREKDGKTYANVSSVGGVPKGMQKPSLEGDAVLYDSDHLWAYDKLSKYLREKVDSRIKDEPKTNGGYHGGPAFDQDLDDDVPF